MQSDTDEIKQYISELATVIEQKTLAETQRVTAEEERVQAERERIAVNRKNEQLLAQTVDLLHQLVSMVTEIMPQLDSQSAKVEMIFEMMRIIVGWLYSQGYREAQHLDEIIKQVSQRSDMKVDIHSGRDTNTGDIVDGTNTKTGDFMTALIDARTAIEAGETKKAEDALNTLPEDAIDVAVAALQSPLQAALMVAKKIGGKIKLLRAGQDC